MQGLYEYTQRKPQPRTFPHTGESRQYNADCLCLSCRAENQRRHPEEYAVFQAVPAPGATVTDLTTVEMRTFTHYSHRVGKKHLVRRPISDKKFEHVCAAMILSL